MPGIWPIAKCMSQSETFLYQVAGLPWDTDLVKRAAIAILAVTLSYENGAEFHEP